MERPRFKYSLGLDIGSESIGWAVVELDEENNPIKLHAMGVRTFEAVQRETDTSNTPAKERRIARSQRRRLRNKKRRKRRFVELCIEKGLLQSKSESVYFLEAGKEKESPWELRVKGLDYLLERDEWFRVLYHLLNHRGFDVHLKASDENKGKMKEAASRIRNTWKQKGYRTVAEYFEKDEEWISKYGKRRRNKEGDYSFTVHRDDIIEEAKILFESQRKLGNPFADFDFESRYLSILNEQPRIVEGDELRNLVGECTLEPGEPRAPKAALTSQIFVACQTLAHLRVVDLETGEEIRLNRNHIERLIEKGFEKKEIKPADIFKVLNVDEGSILNMSDKETIFSFKYFHDVKKTLGNEHKEFVERLKDPELFDKIADVLTYYKKFDSAKQQLLDLGIDERIADKLANLDFKDHHKLSLKAMKNLLPYLKEGNTYSDALLKAGYREKEVVENLNFNGKLPPFDSEYAHPDIRRKFLYITNPNVKRSLTQARKVFNAIVEKFGMPHRVCIELARDLTLSAKDKKRIQDEQRMREKERKIYEEKLKESLKRLGMDESKLTSKLIDKYILYEQQDGKSAYSLKKIEFERMLIDETYTEIDHIIPRSISYNDSFANKVLVLTDDNRNKGDELAAVFIKRHFGESHYERFKKEFVEGILQQKLKSSPHRYREIKRKMEYLCKEEVSEEEKTKLQERFIASTGYASRFFKEVLETYYGKREKSADQINNGMQVIPVRGALTAQLRKSAGLDELKKRGESDKHHAVDAALCALVDLKIINNLSNYYKNLDSHRRYRTNDKESRIFKPYEGFKEDVIKLYDSLIVSRSPRKRATGRGHKDTIYSISHIIKSGFDIPKKGRISLPKDAPLPKKRVRLDQLSPAEIDAILKEPSPILVDEKSNWKLYDLIRKRLRETEPQKDSDKKNWAKIAFGSEEGKIYMPMKNGGRGPEVKKITIYTHVKSGVYVRGGIAENANLVRLDFYRKKDNKGKYLHYVVPVYTSDIALGISPKKAAIQGKDESEWIEIDDTFEFMFHLFPGEYLKIQKTEGSYEQLVVFKYFDRTLVRLIVDNPDRSIKNFEFSPKTCYKIEKVYVDILGSIHPIKKEKRIY